MVKDMNGSDFETLSDKLRLLKILVGWHGCFNHDNIFLIRHWMGQSRFAWYNKSKHPPSGLKTEHHWTLKNCSPSNSPLRHTPYSKTCPTGRKEYRPVHCEIIALGHFFLSFCWVWPGELMLVMWSSQILIFRSVENSRNQNIPQVIKGGDLWSD